jgi:hypothetical protein
LVFVSDFDAAQILDRRVFRVPGCFLDVFFVFFLCFFGVAFFGAEFDTAFKVSYGSAYSALTFSDYGSAHNITEFVIG